jgi:hypothetical protein
LPENTHLAKHVLGHRNSETTRRHYIKAAEFDAMLGYQSEVAKLIQRSRRRRRGKY